MRAILGRALLRLLDRFCSPGSGGIKERLYAAIAPRRGQSLKSADRLRDQAHLTSAGPCNVPEIGVQRNPHLWLRGPKCEIEMSFGVH